jgi:hypothetical protein
MVLDLKGAEVQLGDLRLGLLLGERDCGGQNRPGEQGRQEGRGEYDGEVLPEFHGLLLSLTLLNVKAEAWFVSGV